MKEQQIAEILPGRIRHRVSVVPLALPPKIMAPPTAIECESNEWLPLMWSDHSSSAGIFHVSGHGVISLKCSGHRPD